MKSKDKSRRYEDFSHQYKHYKEHINEKFPEATLEEMLTTLFYDSDHAHDLVTGRSIT